MNELTKEQEAQLATVRKEYEDAFFTYQRTKIDPAICEKGVNFLYEKAGYKNPTVVYCTSPMDMQVKAKAEYKKEFKKEHDGDFTFNHYCCIGDHGWVSFYDFFTRIGETKDEDFNKYCEFVSSGVYSMLQFEDFCFVCPMPTLISRNADNVPHSAAGPAMQWGDGQGVYFWNGVKVDSRWIINPDSIDKEEILKEDNAEQRRVIREILGGETYYERTFGKDGLVLLDEDDDDQGFPMKLWETKEPDPIIRRKVQFVVVIDPSTGRTYDLYPPRQNSTNVWMAKADTFDNKKLTFRHGDLGLVDTSMPDLEKPLKET